MDPPDTLVQLSTRLPPELVEHIFSFTLREHASAASLFRLATKLCVINRVESFQCRHNTLRRQSHMEYSVTSGDLPMVRWMLTARPDKYQSCSWNFLAMRCAPFEIKDHCLH